MATLDRLRLSGFKSIKSMDMAFRGLNVLIGPNGVGKSNLVSFFRFMNRVLQKDMQLYVAQQGGAERFLYFGSKVTSSIDVYIELSPNAYSCKLVPTADGGLIFASEECYLFPNAFGWGGGTKTYPLAKPGATESGLLVKDPPEGPKSWVSHHLSYWKVYHFHDTSDTAKVKKPSNINDVDALRPDASNLAAFLRNVRETDQDAYIEIVETIQRIAPFFQDFILEPDRASPEQIRLRWKHRGSDAYFDANDLSDGTLRFICLATLLLQPGLPSMILLDEPELGLHPHAIELLGALMRSVATKTQILASTQSVTLANQIPWEDLIVVDRVDDASSFRRLREDEVKPWLDEFGGGDIWRKNLVGGTPR